MLTGQMQQAATAAQPMGLAMSRGHCRRSLMKEQRRPVRLAMASAHRVMHGSVCVELAMPYPLCPFVFHLAGPCCPVPKQQRRASRHAGVGMQWSEKACCGRSIGWSAL